MRPSALRPQQTPPREPELAGPFPPDLHDVRHLWLKAVLLAVWVLASFVATYFARDLQVYSLPLKFKSFDEVDYVRSRMDAGFSKALESAGFVNFGFAEGGFAYVMSKNAPVSSVAALRKQRVWIPDNDRQSEEALKSFSVTPVPLSLADVLPSLQTGIIDTVASSPIGAATAGAAAGAAALVAAPVPRDFWMPMPTARPTASVTAAISTKASTRFSGSSS